jgi:bifunctional DNA-binding transcriptional regulator/antitoxin component of YhaV-PrlF toxin-antitoxin module
MPLLRKTRVAGKSMVITLPRQIVEAYDIQNGDVLEITPLEPGTLLMKKRYDEGTLR